MTLESLLTQMGSGTKQLTDRYSEYSAPAYEPDHHIYYSHELSEPTYSHVGSSKHNYGGGHKSGASMSALTLLAFLFFLHILQQCIKDHMTDMSASQPVVVMTAGREGEGIISKSVISKIDRSGITKTFDKTDSDKDQDNVKNQNNNRLIEMTNPYDRNNSNNKQTLRIKDTNAQATKSQQKYNYVYKNNSNRSSLLSGFVSAMSED